MTVKTFESILVENFEGFEGYGSIIVESDLKVILSITENHLDSNNIVSIEKYKSVVLGKFNATEKAISFAEKVHSSLINSYNEEAENKKINFSLAEEVEIYA